ncbi:murein biosynthesis protein MurJ [Micrococcus antarcticus]|uniref:murein biosynthesis integral membrane protein MurJ n=1 Tax=Micrococcus antarcticus TaxID=86171 RepID=UPI00384DB7F8
MSSRPAPRRALETAPAATPTQDEVTAEGAAQTASPGATPSAATEATAPADVVPEGEQRAARSTAIMAAGTLASRVLGFVRTILLAVAIGSTALVADVFESANTIPNVIYMLLAGGIFNVVLVPQLIKHAKDADRGADYTSRLMTLATLVMAAFTVLLTLAAAPLMSTLTAGWSEPMLALGTVLAVWTLPQVFFYGMYAIVGQVLNAHGRFGAYMWAPVVNNVVAIATIVLYLVMFGRYSGGDQLAEWTTTQTMVLAGGHTLGIVAQALILFLPLRRLGLGLRPTFGWRGMGLRSTGRLAGWTLLTMLVGNVVNLLCTRIVTGATAARADASARIPGTEGWSDAFAQAAVPGLQAYNVGMLIAILPHSVFVISLATVLFNRLTRAVGRGDDGAVRDSLRSGLRAFTVPLLFAVGLYVVLAGPLGRIFGSSADTALASGVAIGQILLILAAGLPFRSASFYLLRSFYAAEDARTPMVIQVTSALGMLVLAYAGAWVLPAWSFGHWVAAVGTLSYVYQFVVAHVLTARRIGDYGLASVVAAHAQTGLAALVAAVPGAAVVWMLGGYDGGYAWDSILTALLTCALTGAVMAPVYLMVLRALRFPELDDALRPIVSRVPALGRVLGSRSPSAR